MTVLPLWLALSAGATVQLTAERLVHGVALRKKNVTPAALLAAKTPDEVRAAGNTTMSMTATHLLRDGDEWIIDELGFTPCECDFDKPSWHIATSRTTLNLETDRASL